MAKNLGGAARRLSKQNLSRVLASSLLVGVSVFAGCAAGPGQPEGEPTDAVANDLYGTYTYGSGCSAAKVALLQDASVIGRSAAASPAFEQCLRDAIVTNPSGAQGYRSCKGDPFENDAAETQLAGVLAVARSLNDVASNCDESTTSGNGSAGIGTYGHTTPENFSWHEWLTSVTAQAALSNVCTGGASPPGCRFAAFPWPHSQITETFWHEVMHTHGYGHGANTPAEADIAKTNCGRTADAGWYFQSNTMPYIVGRCVADVIAKSATSTGANCNASLTCANGGRAIVSSWSDSSPCDCMDDPAAHGLGVLQDRSGTMFGTDKAVAGKFISGGWNFGLDNQVLGTADLDGDSKQDFLLRSPWGLGVVGGGLESGGRNPLSVRGAIAFGSTVAGWSFADGQSVVVLGDTNADRRGDLLVKDATQGLMVFSLNGSGGWQQVGRWTWGSVATGGWRIGPGDVYRRMGDFDGDGNADILVSSAWGIGVLSVGAGGSLTTKAAAPYGSSVGSFTLSSSDILPATGNFAGLAVPPARTTQDILVRSSTGIGILGSSPSGFTLLASASHGTALAGGWTLGAGDNVRTTIRNGTLDEIVVHRFSYGAPYGWTDIASLQVSGTTLKATAISRPGTYMGWFGRNVNDSIPGTLSGNVDGDSAGEFVITSGWGYAVIERQGTSFVAISGASYGSVTGEWINRSSQGFLGFVDLDGNGRTELLVRD